METECRQTFQIGVPSEVQLCKPSNSNGFYWVEGNLATYLQYIARFGSLSSVSRRVYPAKLVINGRHLETVVIDPHYEEKHADSVSDEIILGLVKLLDGKSFRPAEVDDEDFQYFVNDHLEFDDRFYKLIWLLHDKELFVGIVNAYRR